MKASLLFRFAFVLTVLAALPWPAGATTSLGPPFESLRYDGTAYDDPPLNRWDSTAWATASLDGAVRFNGTVDQKLAGLGRYSGVVNPPVIGNAPQAWTYGLLRFQTATPRPLNRFDITVRVHVRHALARAVPNDLLALAQVSPLLYSETCMCSMESEAGGPLVADDATPLTPGWPDVQEITNQDLVITWSVVSATDRPLRHHLDFEVGFEGMASGGSLPGPTTVELDAVITGVEASY